MDQLLSLKSELSPYFDVYCFNFPGHGNSDPVESFSMQAFAKAIADFIEKHQLDKPMVFGYSMGGYVAVYLASLYPGIFQKIITLGTKYEWSEEIAAKETKMLRPEVIEEKVPAFAQQLAERHGHAEWKNLLHKTAAMLLALGKDPLLPVAVLQKIDCPTLVLIGEKDTMVSPQETQNAATALVNSQYQILPNTAHPIEQVDVKLLAEKIKAFLLDH